MKILQINSVCGYGSTGRIATDLYKVLEEQGHECIIAYGRGMAPEGFRTIKIGTNFDNYIHVAKTRLFDKHGFGSTKATKEFIKKVEEYDPDVIHLHNIHGYYINIEILFDYLKRANKKVIWTLHDCWAFTGHCAHFDYVGCNKWQTNCGKCIQKKQYPKSSLVDNSEKNFIRKKQIFNEVNKLRIVVVSNWLKEVVKQSMLRNNRIDVIYNGIDLNIFKKSTGEVSRKKYKLDNKFVILGVATIWDKRKGLDDFKKIASKIDKESIVVLVGLSNKQIESLPDNIIGINRTDNINELVDLYSCADVFVNTSVEETFGLVTIEAMSCGTPTIVYNSTACPELVDNSCGIVVEKSNIEEILSAIKEVKEKGKDYYSNSCIERVKRLYNKADIYDKYISIYKNMTNNN
ncbi:glycosyltransferase [Clostridium disporicum]|uniref:Group 1 glycosyl transferase n=1 Tax=Clostridium disporicum TaxID=84024 RepID=A0A174F530_9CLOT|nr:glycosyltransferase [Clostridium disporicum]CUO44028.1 group 1 glycosyl transferase [Clostridium disporicum]